MKLCSFNSLKFFHNILTTKRAACGGGPFSFLRILHAQTLIFTQDYTIFEANSNFINLAIILC